MANIFLLERNLWIQASKHLSSQESKINRSPKIHLTTSRVHSSSNRSLILGIAWAKAVPLDSGILLLLKISPNISELREIKVRSSRKSSFNPMMKKFQGSLITRKSRSIRQCSLKILFLILRLISQMRTSLWYREHNPLWKNITLQNLNLDLKENQSLRFNSARWGDISKPQEWIGFNLIIQKLSILGQNQ